MGALFAGVDVGSATTKVVLVDAAGTPRARALAPTGVDFAPVARACLDQAIAAAGAESGDLSRTVATGYGRHTVPFADATRTEIECHGLGCYRHVPRAITVVDIGGQDNKVIGLAADGRRLRFRMNRKCAAGTGAFLEEIALRLALPLEALDGLARQATAAATLSSFCTVFAKTEILAHLRQGMPVAALVRGAFAAVVARVLEMDPLAGEVVLSGGVVAHNPTIAEMISERLGRPVAVPPEPQLAGALGAALVAAGVGPCATGAGGT